MSLLLVPGGVVYALVGLCAARFGFSLAAYSGRQSFSTYNHGLMWRTSDDPAFRPNLGIGYIVAVGFGIGWPLVLAVEAIRWSRPWRVLRLLSWCASPAERRWLAAKRQQEVETAEKELGIQ